MGEMCEVKGVTRNDEQTENCHPTAALWCILASFSSLFWFLASPVDLHWFSSVLLLSSALFPAGKATVYKWPSTKQQMGKVTLLPGKQSGAFSS